MMSAFTDDMRRNPYPIYEQLRTASPVLQMPGSDIWMILDYEGVKRALSDGETLELNVSRSVSARLTPS